MKNANIEKINNLGSKSRKILTLVKIISIIGIAGCIIGGIFIGIFVGDDNKFDITGTATAQIVVDEEIRAIIKDEKINVGGLELFSLQDLEDSDLILDAIDTQMNIDVERTEENNVSVYDIKADANGSGINPLKATLFINIAKGLIMSVITLIISIFGVKLAKALEKCETPFEENIIKAMKNFGYSFIPMGVIYIMQGGIGITCIVFVLAIFILTYIFKYCAELQRESDETL